MPPSSRIPPLLEPYIHLPHDDSLLLLTSTLGASANWLLIRFLCHALNTAPDVGEEEHNVVLVSWMREYDFWRQEARKGAALDLERLKKEGRFVFVDGLSGLCLGDADAASTAQPLGAGVDEGRISSASSATASRVIPVRGPPGRLVPARGPPVPAAHTASASTATATAGTSTTTNTKSSTPGHYTLTSLDLAHLQSTLSSALFAFPTSTSTAPRRTFLVLDNPDLVLALNPTISPFALTSLLLTLHALPTVSHILVHLQADTPLLSLSTPPQPLQHTHHNFLVKYAHMSRRILGVRVLDTGVARDVSGVVRVTEQKTDWTDLGVQEEGKAREGDGCGKEYLYQVKGDASVRVFERGAGGEG